VSSSRFLCWLFVAALVALFFISIAVKHADAADRLLRLVQPRGFEGEGHAQNHQHYDGLRNPAGMSCCNGKDCRPTVARNINGVWQIMVNGEWRSDFSNERILNDAWLQLEQQRLHQPITGRWDTQAHVCASTVPVGSKYKATIYCVILSDLWN
jgi:hypothetical protein